MQLDKKISNMQFQKFFSHKMIGGLIFNTFLILPGIIFLFMGFQWLVAPESGASALMMPLLDGAGLSSQMGDIGGLFLGMGLLVMGAVTTRKGDWLFSVALLLSCFVLYRCMAFLLHNATFTTQMVVFEMVLAIWFFIASKKLSQKESKNA